MPDRVTANTTVYADSIAARVPPEVLDALVNDHMRQHLRLHPPGVDILRDGYPRVWHDTGGGYGVKHYVRNVAGNRCERCRHPYSKGEGEWSRCDDQCTHGGASHPGGSAMRVWTVEETWSPFDPSPEACAAAIATLAPIPVEARWRILTVHHLTGHWGNTEEAKRDLRWWNLAALCQVCHLQIQGKVQMGRPWPSVHTPWFQPHAAGWYAVKYLGLDLTREETLARLDELLELGRREEAIERMDLS